MTATMNRKLNQILKETHDLIWQPFEEKHQRLQLFPQAFKTFINDFYFESDSSYSDSELRKILGVKRYNTFIKQIDIDNEGNPETTKILKILHLGTKPKDIEQVIEVSEDELKKYREYILEKIDVMQQAEFNKVQKTKLFKSICLYVGVMYLYLRQLLADELG